MLCSIEGQSIHAQPEGVSHECGLEGHKIFLKKMSRAWNTSLSRLKFENDGLL